MTDPRLVIVGPGAMGCGMAALLSERGAHVALLDYKPDRAEQIQRDGLRVWQERLGRIVDVPCSADPQALGIADLVIVLVKAYATGEAIRHALPCVGPSTTVLTLQNGLGNHETIAQHVSPPQVLAGTIVMGCASLGIGEVRISGVGEIVLGSPCGNVALARATARLLRSYWPRVRHEPRIENALWRKVIINAAINPLTALCRVRNGELLEDPNLRERLAMIVREATAVALACGADPFGDEDPVAAAQDVCRITAGNKSSMLQDIEAGRRTEVDAICGEIVRRGKAAGVRAPLCEKLGDTVEIIGWARVRLRAKEAFSGLLRALPPEAPSEPITADLARFLRQCGPGAPRPVRLRADSQGREGERAARDELPACAEGPDLADLAALLKRAKGIWSV